MPEQSTPLTIVVAGDSLATSFGLPARAPAFPQLLRGAFGDAARVTSLARQNRMIDYTRERVDRIIALNPDVVVLWHGGREATFTQTFPLPQLSIDLTKRYPWTVGGVLRRIKQALFAALVAGITSQLGDRVPALIGIKPGMTSPQFFHEFQEVVTHLTEQTDATLFIVLTYISGMNQFPHSRSCLAANDAFLRAFDDGGKRIVIIDGGAEMRFSAQNFLSDRCHLAQQGHAMMAALIEKHIRANWSLSTP